MGPTYVCRCSLAHPCGKITGAGVRAENPMTLVLHCIAYFSLFPPLHVPEVEEGLEPQPRRAGKSTDKSLHSCLTLCRKQFPPIPMAAVHSVEIQRVNWTGLMVHANFKIL